jgi:hypothetical protein
VELVEKELHKITIDSDLAEMGVDDGTGRKEHG